MKFINLLFIAIIIGGCGQPPATEGEQAVEETMSFENKGHEAVYKLTQKVGSYQKLRDLKDVVYTYTYITADGKEDQSIEKYIFDGELSYADYIKRGRTLPNVEGRLVQGFDGQNFWSTVDGVLTEDSDVIKRAVFSRKTNFYWFTMFQKLLDPSVEYTYVKEEDINGQSYDVVKITFESDKPTDIYQLYINQETSLVDQFLFTVVDFNVVDTPFLMKLDYEEVDGLLIPTTRDYTQATWEGVNQNENWIKVRWSNIQFNNNLDKEIFLAGAN